MKLILTLLLTINIALCQDGMIILKGQPAPKDGFFLDKDAMVKISNEQDELKLTKQKVIKLEELGIVKDQKIEHYKDVATDARKELKEEQVKGFFGKTLYFIGGVLLTGAIAYGLQKSLH